MSLQSIPVVPQVSATPPVGKPLAGRVASDTGTAFADVFGELTGPPDQPPAPRRTAVAAPAKGVTAGGSKVDEPPADALGDTPPPAAVAPTLLGMVPPPAQEPAAAAAERWPIDGPASESTDEGAAGTDRPSASIVGAVMPADISEGTRLPAAAAAVVPHGSQQPQADPGAARTTRELSNAPTNDAGEIPGVVSDTLRTTAGEAAAVREGRTESGGEARGLTPPGGRAVPGHDLPPVPDDTISRQASPAGLPEPGGEAASARRGDGGVPREPVRADHQPVVPTPVPPASMDAPDDPAVPARDPAAQVAPGAAAQFLQRERALGRASLDTVPAPSRLPLAVADGEVTNPEPVEEGATEPVTRLPASDQPRAPMSAGEIASARPKGQAAPFAPDAGRADGQRRFAGPATAQEFLDRAAGAPADATMRQAVFASVVRATHGATPGAEPGAELGGLRGQHGMPAIHGAPVVLDGLEAKFQAWLASAASTGDVAAGATPGQVPDVPAQVVKAIHLQWREGLGEARVQLRPEHLGSVTVSLRVEQGHVVATVRAESPSAMEMIRARQQELQSALAAQGLELDELVVSLDPDDRRDRPAYRDPEEAKGPRRRDTGARFEVVA